MHSRYDILIRKQQCLSCVVASVQLVNDELLDALDLVSMGALDSALKRAVIIVDQQVSLDFRILHDLDNDINIYVECFVFRALLCSRVILKSVLKTNCRPAVRSDSAKCVFDLLAEVAVRSNSR